MPTPLPNTDWGAIARTELMSALRSPVWSIRGDALNIVAGHLAGLALSFAYDGGSDDADEETPYEIDGNGVAIIPVQGLLIDSAPTWWMSYLGYSSTPQIREMVEHAAANPDVESILLYVDSPGGQVDGIAGVADSVFTVRESAVKPIWAACRQVCSAAYWIASQCDHVLLAQDALAGCIGTLMVRQDWSGYFTQGGVVALRLTSTGAETYKGEGALGTEITPAQQADFKRICDEWQALFSAGVQRGRGLDAAAVTVLADGRVHVGANALALKLVDGIADPDDVLAALGGGDDLDMGGSGAPDDEGDGDPSDVLGSTIADRGWFTRIAAWFNGGAQGDNDVNLGRTTPQSHPVLAAALGAGIDTTEKLNDILARAASAEGLKVKADGYDAFVTAQRAQAKKDAIIAFGQEGGAAEADIIDGLAAGSALTAYAGRMATAAAKVVPVEGGKRTTAPTAFAQDADRGDGTAQTPEAAAEERAAATAKALDPNAIYAARNGKRK